MVVRLAVPVGALQPRRYYHQPTFPPNPALNVIDAPAIAGTGEPRLLLQVLQRRMVGVLEDLLHPCLTRQPGSLPLTITGQPGTPGLLPERRMQHRHALVMRNRQVGVHRAAPGLLSRLALQLENPLLRRVRLSRQLLPQYLVIGPLPLRRPAELLPRPRVRLLVHR